MAQRRMFSPQIVESDAFLDMPLTAQALYFHLGMNADDDGFISPRKIIRMLGAAEDDLKLLIAKRFLLPCENGVVVIKHWNRNNLIRKDFYKPTEYLEQKSKLFLKENGIYTDDPEQGNLITEPQKRPNDILLTEPQRAVNVGKVRLGKERKENPTAKAVKKFTTLGAEVLKLLEVVDPKNKTYYNNKSQRAAADFLVEEYGLEEVRKRVTVLPQTNKLPYWPTITTPCQLRDKWVQLEDAAARAKQKTGAAANVAF